MSSGEQERAGRVTDFEQFVEGIRSKLKAGGPPVDFAAIHLHIAGDLGEEDSRRVRERIVTWESWYEAYWETMADLEEVRAYEEDETAGGGLRPELQGADVRDWDRFIDDERISAEIDRLVAPFRSGDRAISEFNLPTIVEHVEQLLLSDKELPPAERLRFYESIAANIDDVLCEHARQRVLNEKDEAAQPVPSRSDTVASQDLETTLVVTTSEAKRFLARHQALDEVAEYAPDAARYYRLVRFAGRDQEEIADLASQPLAVVNKRFASAEAALNLAESQIGD